MKCTIDDVEIEIDPIAVLEKAKAFIRENGFCQMDWQNDKGNVCLGATMTHALTGQTEFFPTFALGSRAAVISELLGLSTTWDICGWNNTPGRKLEDFAELFDGRLAHYRAEAEKLPAA